MILEPQLVAEGWFDLQGAKLTKHERKLGLWAEEVLQAAIWNDADYAFSIVSLIHELDSEQKYVETFAAGPVEDLLSWQGASVIDRIEGLARRDPKFAFVLGGVWQNNMTDEIWARVQAAQQRKGWDGQG